MMHANSLAGRLRWQAQAIARKSPLARKLALRLRSLKATLTPTNPARELALLIGFLQQNRCTFVGRLERGALPQPRTIMLRYDVYPADLRAAPVFVRIHREHGIPAAWFLPSGHTGSDPTKRADYLRLIKEIESPSHVGLLDVPAESFLITQRFAGNKKAFAAWLHSNDALEWLKDLAQTPERQAELNASILKAFVARVKTAKEIFGPLAAVAAGRGPLVGALQDRVALLDSPALAAMRSLSPAAWLTPDRVSAAGLELNVDDFKHSLPHWHLVSDEGGKVRAMVETLRRYVLIENTATQILLHPQTWSGGWRDAGFSDLLPRAAALPSRVGGAVTSMPISESPTQLAYGEAPDGPPLLKIHAGPPDEKCGPVCTRNFGRWREWFMTTFSTTSPQPGVLESDPDAAMLVIPERIQEYETELLHPKARTKIRKATKNGYRFAEIDASKFLDDIYAINTSATMRQGQPMSVNYSRRPNFPASESERFCLRHRIRTFGVLKSETLVAYCRVWIVDELAVFAIILGHREHETFGIMNLLIRETVNLFIIEGRTVRAINYRHMTSSTEGLRAFKHSVGFRPRRTAWTEDPRPAASVTLHPRRGRSAAHGSVNRLADLIEQKRISKVIMRGDCCSWRCVLRNPQLFGVKQQQIVRDQKAPTIVYLDHLRGISYPDDLLASQCHIDRMGTSLRSYYLGQNKRETLKAGGNLLVMDSFADANYQLHEHKKIGAKIWVDSKYVQRPFDFDRTHRLLPMRSFDQVLQDIVEYIAHIRSNNPGIPVLYLSQPIHFYPLLHGRREFCYLGAELERIVPDLYWGGHLPPERLSPDDMDSCGPGSTLHFMPETYADMVRIAMRRAAK
jgi:hypothetical protein